MAGVMPNPAAVKRVTSKKPYLLTRDDDGHWYLLPYDLRKDFEAWVTYEGAYSCGIVREPWIGTDYNEYRINGPHTLKIYSWSDDQ